MESNCKTVGKAKYENKCRWADIGERCRLSKDN